MLRISGHDVLCKATRRVKMMCLGGNEEQVLPSATLHCGGSSATTRGFWNKFTLRPGENVPPNRLSPISAARTLPDLTLPDRPDIVCYVENASITAERERERETRAAAATAAAAVRCALCCSTCASWNHSFGHAHDLLFRAHSSLLGTSCIVILSTLSHI